MKLWFPIAAAILLSACSNAPTESKAKVPEKPLEPLTGRQAFYQTYPQGRAWALDCVPLRIRSFDLDMGKDTPKPEPGKATAWEILYVSPAKGRQRTYTWSAIESEGNLHKGVFAGLEESWSNSPASSKPFVVQAIKIDTPEALETAVKNSATYFKNPGEKPRAKFVLEYTSRYPDPAWRVYWGESVSSAEWSVFIDTATGEYLGR